MLGPEATAGPAIEEIKTASQLKVLQKNKPRKRDLPKLEHENPIGSRYLFGWS